METFCAILSKGRFSKRTLFELATVRAILLGLFFLLFLPVRHISSGSPLSTVLIISNTMTGDITCSIIDFTSVRIYIYFYFFLLTLSSLRRPCCFPARPHALSTKIRPSHVTISAHISLQAHHGNRSFYWLAQSISKSTLLARPKRSVFIPFLVPFLI